MEVIEKPINMPRPNARFTVFISTPLEVEHVDQIKATDPNLIEVIFEPDLLPATRYKADHNGQDGFTLNPEQMKRWNNHLECADILWDFPPTFQNEPNPMKIAKHLKWIQATSSGVAKHISRLDISKSNILITTARGVHSGPLAEFVFLALLSHVKRLLHLQKEQKKHHWERFCGDELENKTLGIIGMGKIGKRVASVGRCFKMRVIAIARTGSENTADQLGVDALFPSEKLHEMLKQTDALVLSLPHTPQTEGMMNSAAFSALKPGAVFVNIARGQVVDEQALLSHLQTGRIGFAALDPFTVEPLAANSPLWDLPNVLICPHSASTVESENRKITEIFCHNLRCYMNGRFNEMKNIFNKTLMY